jgi:hypothetical protein
MKNLRMNLGTARRGRVSARVLVCGAALVLVGVVAGLAGAARADSGSPASNFGPASPPPASGWQIGYYTPSLRTLSYAQAFKGTGEASLNFTIAPYTALLITGQKAKYPSLLGDLSADSTVSADLTVSGVTGLFTYMGEPSCGPTPQEGGIEANVRFYFQTSNAGGFNETHYWWSNPISLPLLGPTSNGTTTLNWDLNGADWSDYYGHPGIGPYAAGFAAALSNVTDIGLSFGGGCFFENGVGTTDGSGTFTINSFTVG